jgi:uncharacterized protein YecA (UPF0149 family)
MQPLEFLQAELDHAERQLARVRRIQTQMQAGLEATGLDEVTVYEKLAAHKAYRQLQRDEITFQQVWLRVHRHRERLERLERTVAKTKPAEDSIPYDMAMKALHHVAAAAAPKPPQTPYRKPVTPTRNAPCSCGSGVKYKRCCGNPLRQAA